tara:strand:+ start:172 stop:954 length:783 start_codon:yes stop_codon:yes gene_type:complete
MERDSKKESDYYSSILKDRLSKGKLTEEPYNLLMNEYPFVPSCFKDLLENQVFPKTREIMHEMKEDPLHFPDSTDHQTLNLLFTMIILSKSTKILQLGTWMGFSGLVILDALSKSDGEGNKMFVTVDPNDLQHSKAMNFFDKAGFKKLYQLVTFASESSEAENSTIKYSPYDVIYIDSAHNDVQIIKELEIYFKMLRNGGLLICHDSGDLNGLPNSNVRKGLKEFIKKNHVEGIFFDKDGKKGWHFTGAFLGKKYDPLRG